MRRQKLCGLLIITISGGESVGTVKDVVIDPLAKRVAFFLVEDPAWLGGAKVVPFDAIRGIGEDAAIIEEPEEVILVSESEEAEELLKKNIRLIGTKAITTAGESLGNVVDFWVDPKNGEIASCDVKKSDSSTPVSIPHKRLLTLGKDALIALTEAEEKIGERKAVAKKAEKPAPKAKEAEKEKAAAVAERQHEFLLGKTLKEDIFSDDGNLLFKAGQVVTEEIIKQAKEANKYLKLTFSVK